MPLGREHSLSLLPAFPQLWTGGIGMWVRRGPVPLCSASAGPARQGRCGARGSDPAAQAESPPAIRQRSLIRGAAACPLPLDPHLPKISLHQRISHPPGVFDASCYQLIESPWERAQRDGLQLGPCVLLPHHLPLTPGQHTPFPIYLFLLLNLFSK